MKTKKHTIWHYLLTIAYAQTLNLFWVSSALALLIGGILVFTKADTAFLKIAIGLPMALIGLSIFAFKLHEVILLLVNPKFVRQTCIVCNK